MRKGLTILGVFCIILTVLGAAVLPVLLQGQLRSYLTERLATNDVQVQLHSEPSLLLALGDIHRLEAVARQAKVGQVYVKELTLQGEGLRLDMAGLCSGEPPALVRARRLELTGIVDEENLREVLSRKVERIENVQVAVQPEDILITAEAKFFGRKAEIEMHGLVVEDAGSLYFRMTSLSLKQTRLGTAKLGEMFGHIQLMPQGKLPLGLQLTDVHQTEGAVVIKAERKEQLSAD